MIRREYKILKGAELMKKVFVILGVCFSLLLTSTLVYAGNVLICEDKTGETFRDS